jgi:ribosome biogenesis GTPase
VERTGDGRAAIVAVEPRRSVLLRPEVAGRWRRQVLVANADLAVLVFAHRDPAPAAGLLDRLLVACHAGEVPVVLVFNKSDLEPEPETAALVRLYEGLGFRVLRTSAEREQGIPELQATLRDRCAVFAGPSGAGKSSLVNRALPGVRLRTGEISRSTGKGRHTTTAAQLVRVPGACGHVIDTPGIREFGVVTIAPGEVALHFPEFPDPGSCRFADCRHLAEPGCAVLESVRAGRVAASRHASYRVLREELEEEERRDRGEGGGRRSGRARGRDGNAACTQGARG